MKENNFQTVLVRGLRESGALVFNLHGHAMQVSGIPDLYVAHPIWSGWLELKTGNNVLTKLQQKTLKNLEINKVNCFVLVEKVPRILIKDSSWCLIAEILFSPSTFDGIGLLNYLKTIGNQLIIQSN